MSGLTGYDRWLESGPGGPHDDGEEDCEACDGTGDAEHLGRTERCVRCDGTGTVLASDDCNEDDLTDAEADHDALEGAGLGSEGY